MSAVPVAPQVFSQLSQSCRTCPGFSEPCEQQDRGQRIPSYLKSATSADSVPGAVLGAGDKQQETEYVETPALMELTFWCRRL